MMLSRDLGGIQQAFLDYDYALKIQKSTIFNVTSTGSAVNNKLDPFPKTLINLGNWDFLSWYSLNKYIKFLKLDIILAHGNRAIYFCKIAKPFNLPLVGIVHNYSIKYLSKADFLITTTKHLRDYLISNNLDKDKIFVIPNMIRIDTVFSPSKYHPVPIIGVIARLIKKKGVDLFLHSLSLLKKQGHNFNAIIGGDGEQKNVLIKLTKELNLQDRVKFVGWITDKESFFKTIDIFCLPSYHEPFGIVLLEAIKYSKPCVITNSEGPSEIIRHNVNGVITHMNFNDLSQGILTLLYDSHYGNTLAKNAFDMIGIDYNASSVSQELIYVIQNILDNVSK